MRMRLIGLFVCLPLFAHAKKATPQEARYFASRMTRS